MLLQDDSDDEIEVLYVRPAPVSTSSTIISTVDAQNNVQCKQKRYAVSPVPPMVGTSAKQQHHHQQQTVAVTPRQPPQTQQQQQQPLYSYRSSAYLQCLAEICYQILWDERWRVIINNNNNKRQSSSS